jgi:hypothetical protein
MNRENDEKLPKDVSKLSTLLTEMCDFDKMRERIITFISRNNPEQQFEFVELD